jgi:hypothetical protein
MIAYSFITIDDSVATHVNEALAKDPTTTLDIPNSIFDPKMDVASTIRALNLSFRLKTMCSEQLGEPSQRLEELFCHLDDLLRLCVTHAMIHWIGL